MCGCLKRMALTRHLILSLTGEAMAVEEVQVLHAFGEDECTDITCEGRRKKEIREDGRRECGCTRIKRSEFIHRNNQ